MAGKRRNVSAGILSAGVALLLAAPVPAANTQMSRSDVPVCSGGELQRWFNATTFSLGVEAADTRGAWIGDFVVYEEDWWIREDDPVYFPFDAVKTTLCGIQAEYTWHDESFSDEADWNLNIVPDPFYASLLLFPASLPYVSDIRPCPCPAGAACTPGSTVDCMQAEVTPDEHVYENPWFPHEGGASAADDKRVCTYGPWVGDIGHGRRPEIHPAEVIWWRDPMGEDSSYTVLLIQEDSNRFDRPHWGEWYYRNADDAPPGWLPWSAPPREPLVRFAFQALAGEPVTKLDVREFEGFRRHVVTADPPSLAADADDGRDHALEVDGMVVVEVSELQVVDDDLGVGFSGVCRSADDSRIQGYVDLRARLSRDDHGQEGFFPLHVVKTTVGATYNPPVLPQAPVGGVIVDVGLYDDSLHGGEAPWAPDLFGDLVITLTPRQETSLEELVIDEIVLVGPGGATLPVEFELTRNPEAGQPTEARVFEVPLLAPRTLRIVTPGGELTRTASGHGLWSRIAADGPFDLPAGEPAWEAIAEAAGGKAVDPPAAVAATATVDLELGAEHVPQQGEDLQPEGSTALTRALDRALAGGDPETLGKLFGTKEPFTTSWSPFTARNLTTGATLQVVPGSERLSDAVAFEVLPPAADGRQGVRLHFPDRGDEVIEVVAAGSVADPYSAAPEARVTVWSHVLQGDAGEALAEALLASAATMRELEANALVAQSRLGVDPEAAIGDERGRAARGARVQALQASDDGRVTVAELRTVLAAVDAWASTGTK